MAQLVLSDSDGGEGQRSPAKTQGPFGLACLTVIIANLSLEAVQERIRGMADREGTDEPLPRTTEFPACECGDRFSGLLLRAGPQSHLRKSVGRGLLKSLTVWVCLNHTAIRKPSNSIKIAP